MTDVTVEQAGPTGPPSRADLQIVRLRTVPIPIVIVVPLILGSTVARVEPR